MKDFDLSMFASKEELYKAKAEYYEAQLKFISEQHWFQIEAEFRLELPVTQTDDSFFWALIDAVDKEIDA